MDQELLTTTAITPTEEKAVIVNTREDFINAGDVLKFIKNKIKRIEVKRISHTSKLLEQKRIIDKDYKSIQQPLLELSKKINAAMVAWHDIEQKRLDEEQKKVDDATLAEEDEREKIRLAKEKETGIKEDNKTEMFIPIVNDIKKIRGNLASSVMAETYNFELLDITKVPLKYLTTDDVKIKKAIKESKGKIEIEGIKVLITKKVSSFRSF